MAIKKNKDFFPILCLVGAIALGFYFVQSKKKRPLSTSFLDQPGRIFTIEEKIKRKKADIQLKKDIQSQEVLSEKFKKPPENIDPFEPDVSAMDMGVRFSDDTSAKSLLKDLDDKPFKNDIYKDPEDIIRRQIAHKDWLRQRLEKKNEQERREFIKKFIKSAQEQGYRVHFSKDMQVVLEPINPEEQSKDDLDLEEVQINWK